MSRKATVLVALSTLVVLIVYFIGHADRTVDRDKTADVVPEGPFELTSASARSTDTPASPQPGTAITIPTARLPADSSLPAAERDQWMQSRGFTGEFNVHYLNDEFLQEAASSGDMLAAQMLGHKYLGTERGDSYLRDAARLGSIRALHLLSHSSELTATAALKSQKGDGIAEFDQHEYSLRALEYLLVAEIRGDNFAAANTIAHLMRRMTYTDQDIAQACFQATVRYAELENFRYSAGLAPFDNALMEGLDSKTFFDEACAE